MGKRDRSERRHQANKAKNREERKNHSWLEGIGGRARKVTIGRLSNHRTQCSCSLCQPERWELSRQGRRAQAALSEQV
jgi:hypothetical protein